MKTKCLTILMLLICSIALGQKTEIYKINTTKSIVKWAGKKIVGGNTEGSIQIANGTLHFVGQNLRTGEIVMDTKSIHSEKASPRLIAHLKNEDFFDVEKFPTAKFVITSVKGNQISGKMTIKGITKDLSFPAEITYSKNTVVAKATQVKVDRTKFDVKYRSGSIFSGLGDGAIEDYFVLDITLIAEK